MSIRMVIDASVTLAWILNEDSLAPQIGRVITRSSVVAPSLWRLEVVNTILVYERRKLLNEQQSFTLLGLIDELTIELIPDAEAHSASAMAQFARPYQLSSYDAVYLKLAIDRRLPLFTRDKNLRAAAKRVGVELI